MWFPICGRLIYEGSLDRKLKGTFVKAPDGSFIQNVREEFSPRITIITPKKVGRINEATVYVFSTIEGVALEMFNDLKEKTGGYIAQTPEEGMLETARELAKAIDKKYTKEVFP